VKEFSQLLIAFGEIMGRSLLTHLLAHTGR